MERGKQVCKILKDIRKQIAEENDIEFITSECKHQGDCAGTCPKCEAELAYLESQLARRSASGLPARLAGIAIGFAAVAPAFTSCDWMTKGDMVPPQVDGEMELPLGGDPVVSDSVHLGANLVFAIISHDDFTTAFTKGGWLQTAIQNVYPNGTTGENIMENITGYTPIKMAVKDEKIKYYRTYNAKDPVNDYAILDYNYDQWSNNLWIGNLHDYIVASINDTEMVCYGPVFSQEWAPDAFLGKYVFSHVEDAVVNKWDELHNIQAE
jgi:hypothetical protein